jgi:hypothetical protein
MIAAHLSDGGDANDALAVVAENDGPTVTGKQERWREMGGSGRREKGGGGRAYQ